MQQTFVQLTPTAGGLMLAGVLLAKRNRDGTLAIRRREDKIHALISAAYGKYISPRVMGYIKCAGQLFAEVPGEDLEYATYPLPRPQNAFSGNDVPAIAKLTMMLALTGLGSMEDKTIAVQRMHKVQRAMNRGACPLVALKKINIVPPDAAKYSPDQPRDDHGRWTDEGNTQVADAGNIKTDANVDGGDKKTNVSGKLMPLRNIPLAPDSNATPYFDESIAPKVSGFFDEVQDSSIPIQMVSGFRTSDTQSTVSGNQYGGALSGNSLHEAGFAFDINWGALTTDQQDKVLDISQKYDLEWGGDFSTPDPVHFYIDPFNNLSERRAYIPKAQQQFQAIQEKAK